jgi:hypothetical protein
MNTKHSPLIRLQAARRAYEAAQGACAHWDMSGTAGADEAHGCCHDLYDAQRELSAARKAVKRSTDGTRRSA